MSHKKKACTGPKLAHELWLDDAYSGNIVKTFKKLIFFWVRVALGSVQEPRESFKFKFSRILQF